MDTPEWSQPLQHNLEDNRALSRREFTRESVLALLAGVAITITACGDDKPTGIASWHEELRDDPND